MGLIVDDIVVNPKEADPGLVEASLSEAGLSIVGADFGEAGIEGNSVRTARGIALVDRQPKTRTVALRLEVRGDADVTLAEAAHRLQQIVGGLQELGGWIRRDPRIGDFAGSLLYKVSGEVTLNNFGAWQVGDSPDVDLIMVCDFTGLSPEEYESAKISMAEGERELVLDLENLGGSAPGVIRYRIDNENETEHLKSVILATECRDHPQDESADTTAALAYYCVDLTPLGMAEEGERGAEKVVRHTELTPQWLAVLDSEIQGVGAMTHVGGRRPQLRLWAGSTDVQIQLRWRSLGTLSWSTNSAVSVPAAEDWVHIDLGSARPERPVIGDPRWQWQLLARSTSGSGSIDLERIRLYPTEQLTVLVAPPINAAPEANKAETPATVESVDRGPTYPAWSNPENAKATDEKYASVELKWPEEADYILGKDFDLEIPPSATVLQLVSRIRCKRTGEGGGVRFEAPYFLIGGSAIHSTASDNLSVTNEEQVLTSWIDTESPFLSTEDRARLTPTYVNASDFAVRYLLFTTSSPIGSMIAYANSISVYAYYTEAENASQVCFAGRSIELRSDGCYRQDGADDVWGRVVEDGFLPFAPAGGLGERKARTIIVPSQGDFDSFPDSGDNKLSAQAFWRRGYPFAREAAG